ncbi:MULTISPECIES: hypothetical protein [Enterococcus]|uniref:hypothetical protein n=1 Tax=Enterococcus TaxID=1350 RepID=UPI000E016407|nr:hypothetical protein [Enterococcus faecalis]MCU9760544.1 hypothetical protein [Enterococcus faecalis]MEB6069643.1 hypothetical protein [Enterococcus faecalis]MEB6188824.1 hypothetical protein [Enterococcus faecalis]RBR62601.1 hypothetical protein EB38_02480 [Enterococcus faecalis]
MKKENVRMRLSSESKILLDELQKNFKTKFGLDVSYSSIVNQAIRTEYKRRPESYWISIKDKKLELGDLNSESDWDYQTSFMLEQDVLEFLLELQVYFKDVFGAKRIHRAFCVRLCIKSYFLNNVT